MARNYWMVVLSPENFAITRQQNFSFQGLKGQQGRKVQRVGPGDRVLFYLSQQRCFTATATVTSQCVEARGLPWQVDDNTEWAYRFDIQPDCVLAPDDYMEAHYIAPRLDYVKKWIPEEWYLAFLGNLHLLPKRDFQLLEDEMRKVHRKRSNGGTGDRRYHRPTAAPTGTSPEPAPTGTSPEPAPTGTGPAAAETGTGPAAAETGTGPAAAETGTSPAAAVTDTGPATAATAAED